MKSVFNSTAITASQAARTGEATKTEGAHYVETG